MSSIAQPAYTSRQMIGATLALLAAIAFSTKTILVKLAYAEQVDAVTLLALRMAFSVPFFVVAAWLARAGQNDVALTGKDKLMVVWLGLIGYYLASLLDFLGLQYINVGLARLILFLYPTMVTLIVAGWLRQRISRAVIFALLVSYAGIALVFMHDVQTLQRDVLLGSALVFGSALAYAIFLVGSPALIHKMGATRFTAQVMLVSCAASVLQFALTHPLENLRLSMRVYELSIAMAVISTVLPAFLLAGAMKRVGATHTSIIGSIGPVSTIALAYWFLDESLSLVQMAGAVLVLAGVLMVSLNKT